MTNPGRRPPPQRPAVSPAFKTALAYAEERIAALIEGLDRPINEFGQPCVLALSIARQAGGVHGDMLRLCAAGRTTSALILLRSIVEAAILVRWIQVDPQLHTDMYLAEDDRMRLAGVPAIEEFRRRRGIPSSGPVFDPVDDARMRKEVEATKAKAIAEGKITKKSNRVLPLVQDMAKVTGDTAIWEAYEILYRVISPWTHFGGRSLAHHEFESRPDGTYIEPRAVLSGEAIRGVAAPTTLVLLGSTSRICGLGFEGEARLLQDTLVLWPREVLDNVDV